MHGQSLQNEMEEKLAITYKIYENNIYLKKTNLLCQF